MRKRDETSKFKIIFTKRRLVIVAVCKGSFQILAGQRNAANGRILIFSRVRLLNARLGSYKFLVARINEEKNEKMNQ